MFLIFLLFIFLLLLRMCPLSCFLYSRARVAMCTSDIGRNNTDCSKDDHKRDQYHPVTPSLACSVWVSCSLTSTVCVPTSPLATPTPLATRSQLSEKNYE